jgi:hypothetical protein
MDTCLVSALAKRDIPDAELEALDQILLRFEEGSITAVCSTAVGDELSKIPAGYRGPHLKQLQQFGSVPRSEPGARTRLTLVGVPGGNPARLLWDRLLAVLPDQADAEHVFIAARNRVQYLITVDGRTLLKHRERVFDLTGVRLVTPSQFIHESLAG